MKIQDFIIRESDVKNPPKLFGFKTGVSGHDQKTLFLEITNTGLVKVGSLLGEDEGETDNE